MTRAQKITEVEQSLAEVKVAISRIVTGGQAYGAENRTMQRADLKVLQDRQTALEGELARLQRKHRISTYGVAL
ncbi:MAG TPA: hypothetical protein DGD08_01785 [Gemmatimonas aurantiaca]|uniref:Uncharacterized protein n=2 Tax=Gemmatimonas aurantiaca TaxID=173480 RepID=C1A9W6_GEMAT|nr:hypothetical protein [Gemmatimonas aurantiaca]BAH39293.1 hypothetical protein GAU_2251 [Gemmatimonas aurantiaca T-27]HCT55924.1 hypothetical protein [Gemmatimonas aurantiaca]